MSEVVGGLNVYASQKAIFDYAQAEIPWDVIDGEVPDSATVQMVNGMVQPYVVMRFSDMLSAGGQGSFGGVRQDGYYSLFQAICVAPRALQALELGSLCNNIFLGYQPTTNDGPISKDFGGGSLTIRGVNSTPTFFVSIVAYRYLTNLQPE